MTPRWTLLLAFVLLAPALAGCIGTDDPSEPSENQTTPPSASMRCYGTDDAQTPKNNSCNYDTLIEPDRQGNEVTIAANPTDPANVVAGAKDYYPESAGDCVWDGIYHTTNAGQSWNSRNLPGSPWLLLNNMSKFNENAASQYWCMSDPVVAFGPNGTLYYTFLAYQGDPATGSATGKEITCAINNATGAVPCSGPNDVVFNRVSIGVMISNDGGETISDTVLIDSGTYPVNFHDRQWVTVDQETGTVYVAWTAIFAPGNLIYRSTDHGQTWDGPVLLNELPAAASAAGSTSPSHLFVDTGPNGTVYVSGCGGDGPYLTKSTDGGRTFGAWQHVINATDNGMNSTYRTGQLCMVAADETGGPHHGRLYMAYSATPNETREVFVTHSTDGADTWSQPVQLNQNATNDQFFPTISINPNGVVDTAWYDRRHDPENRFLDVYHRYSLDGGATFSEELRVTTNSSDPRHSLHQGGFVFIGDYIDIDGTEDCAWPVWVDTRNQKADVMTTCIERPGVPSP